MDFTLNEDQRAFQETARAFAAAEMAPHAARWDGEHIFPTDTLRQAAALGLAAICCDPDHGGTGLSRVDSVLIFEELAAACPSTAAYLSIHNMVAWMVDHFGDETQRARWLPDLATMKTLASYCLTEPDAGSDAAALTTRARADGEDYVINGSKAFISGGPFSDIYACMVRTGAAGARGISCVLVERGTAGLGFGKLEEKLGWHSQPTSAVLFDDCRVPIGNRLGEEGTGFKIALQGLAGGRLNIAACSLGGARACLEAARTYLQERKQFGQPLAAFQGLAFRLADMATELAAARLMVWRGAWLLDQNDGQASMAIAMAKRYATDVGFRVANEALQLHGGYGYLRDYPIERYVRDLRAHQILEGTNEIMRVIIARELLQ
ncbi:MAG: acyl-CoA dehydrogenase family protein [Alphaproteobacteria bacterium]